MPSIHSAPSGKSHKWLSDNFYDFISPTSGPLTPLVVILFLWITTCEAWSRNTKAQLIKRIKEVFEDLPRDTMKLTCARLCSQIEDVVDAEGGFFK